jgi:hypothetical protein
MRTGLLLIVAVAFLGCAWLTTAHYLREPGEVRNDAMEGLRLERVIVPIPGGNSVRLDAKQVKESSDAEVTLLMNQSDKPLDCNHVTLVGMESVQLTNLRYVGSDGRHQGAIGQIPLAQLKTASTPGLKINWCDVEIPFDDAQVSKLKEFVEMAERQ